MAKLNLKDSIEIPEKVKVDMGRIMVKVSGPNGELERRMSHPMIKIQQDKNLISIELKNGTKREKMMMKTYVSHLKNMINGVHDKYTYKLKICSGHFPMNVSKDGLKLVIKNFLGEKIPREADIIEGTEVEVKGQEIIVSSNNKEKAGQTAANIERSTRLTNRDRRRFQDGIYITEKAGVEL